jgi:hypothetical protein
LPQINATSNFFRPCAVNDPIPTMGILAVQQRGAAPGNKSGKRKVPMEMARLADLTQ